MTMYQLSFRFNRGMTSKSVATLEYLYARLSVEGIEKDERRLINNLIKKSKIMKLISGEQAAILYPGEYPIYEEI